MSFAREEREALRLLNGIENATLSTIQAAGLIDEADPALVYFIVTWLRNHYGVDHPASEGVIGRIVDLSNAHSSLTAKMKKGKADPIVEWFEDEFNYRDLGAVEFISIVIEKLEG